MPCCGATLNENLSFSSSYSTFLSRTRTIFRRGSKGSRKEAWELEQDRVFFNRLRVHSPFQIQFDAKVERP